MRTYTVAEIIPMVRRECDAEYDEDWITEAGLIDKIDTAYEWMWEQLVESGLSFFEEEQSIVAVANQDDYALNVNFRGLLAVDYQLSTAVGANDYYEVPALNIHERNHYRFNTHQYARGHRVVGVVAAGVVTNYLRLFPTPQAGVTYRVTYVPNAAKLTATTDVLYAMDGRKDMVVLYAALKCFDKEESPPAHLERRLAVQIERLKQAAEIRGIGQPQRIQDTSESGFDPWYNVDDGA